MSWVEVGCSTTELPLQQLEFGLKIEILYFAVKIWNWIFSKLACWIFKFLMLIDAPNRLVTWSDTHFPGSFFATLRTSKAYCDDICFVRIHYKKTTIPHKVEPKKLQENHYSNMSKQQFLCRDALKPRTHNCIVNLLQINYFLGTIEEIVK